MHAPRLIELDGVGRVFQTDEGEGVHALRDISLVIDPGEFVWITGPSGSGKSTLLQIIGCLDEPTEGVYRYAGSAVASLDDDGIASVRRDEFGFVFQDHSLLESATACENVELPAIYRAIDSRSRRRRARALLERLGVGKRAEHLPAELSGGEQQRVAIARALMNGATTILADEPTGALDSQTGDEVIALLAGLAGRGHAVVLASHDPAVANLATRCVELRDGRVVSDAPSGDRATSMASLPRV
ncbi:MAG: ABC transporter ATP-binding protein [Gammaproteobacteria bacterium]|nr:ABC transporter ATP-binding protein [Gammaproteobacteria bacterium]